jgi:transcriptional antiterminator RfaH
MPVTSSPRGARWFCAWTHPVGEFRAELHLAEQDFTVYLPLHLDRRFVREVGHGHIGPMFPRYLFISLDLARDQWRRIYRSRGIAGLIGEATDRPTPLGIGVVEELIGRTSPRRIVDDPGSAAFPDPTASRQHWRNLTALSGKARSELLLRLFGRDTVLEAA